MNNAITLSQSAYKEILARMNKLEKMIANLMDKFEQEPPYGTEAWWKWSIKKGKEDIKKGRVIEITTKKQRDAFFKSL